MQTLTQTTTETCGCAWNTTTARKMTSCTRHLAIDALKAAQELLRRFHEKRIDATLNSAPYEIDLLKINVKECNQAIGSLATIIRRLTPPTRG